MNIKSYRFPSATGVCEIATNVYTPESGVFDTVLVIHHGMVRSASLEMIISDKQRQVLQICREIRIIVAYRRCSCGEGGFGLSVYHDR